MSKQKIKNLLFNADMAKAIYFGFKTETRRLKAEFEVGDIVRVREPHFVQVHGVECRFSVNDLFGARTDWKSIPGMYMKASNARMYLEVTAVRREALCDITEYSAAHEGVEQFGTGYYRNYLEPTAVCKTAIESFATLWDSINANPKQKNGWLVPFNSNPLVNVIEFKLITRDGVLPQEYMEVLQNG